MICIDEIEIARIKDLFEKLKTGIFPLDDEFDCFYTGLSTELSAQHFSSFYACQQALDYFGSDRSIHVLDIGSGIGKFCFLGGLLTPGHFTGIELRESLHSWAEQVRSATQMDQIQFILGDFQELDFQSYNCFYLFNPFMEYKDTHRKIDDTISTENDAYHFLLRTVLKKLDSLPSGIKLVTYHIASNLIPNNFHLVKRKLGNTMNFYVKN